MVKKIVLIGYMGSGKTKIGKILSKKAQLPFFDLDNLIENQFSKSINEIFSEKGEVYFRKIEQQAFVQKIEEQASFILSLGGGTPCYANNHELLQREDVISIYLKASIATLQSRLEHNRSGRPLLKDLSETELTEYIAKHLFDRAFYYNQCKMTIVVDGKSPEMIADEIQNILF
jgi:shikimate kinase